MSRMQAAMCTRVGISRTDVPARRDRLWCTMHPHKAKTIVCPFQVQVSGSQEIVPLLSFMRDYLFWREKRGKAELHVEVRPVQKKAEGESSTDQVRVALKKHYQLDVKRIERIAYGLWEESFSVWTSSQRYYVKRFYAKWRLQTRYEEMLNGLALSQELRKKGFPAPRLLVPHHQEWLAHDQGETYQVNEWIDGRSYHPGELPLREAKAMGELLAHFHRQFDPLPPFEDVPMLSPSKAIADCRELWSQYQKEQGAFPGYVRDILEQQISLLETVSHEYVSRLPVPSLRGRCFHSYWVEQLIFHPNGEVAALVDWTDGAGREGYWAKDLVAGLHLSALQYEGILAFCEGYQAHHPLPKSEWQAVLAKLCYGHLASTNFLDSWLVKHNRRMEHWETDCDDLDQARSRAIPPLAQARTRSIGYAFPGLSTGYRCGCQG